MLNNIYIIALFLLCSSQSFAGIIVIEGTYQNKNLFVSNSLAGSGVGFCAYEVKVNGELSTDEVQSSAFEIDLSMYHLKYGDNVIIQIAHKDGCTPKVLNPNVLNPLPTFTTKDIKLAGDGTLVWSTTGEDGTLPFIIQQYKWSKWVEVGEVKGKGTKNLHKYSFKVTFVSGQNKFRVIQKSHDGKAKNTPSVTYLSTAPAITHIYNKKKGTIEFSENTSYEIYDVYGQIKKKGFGQKIDISNLSKDDYYLSFDNSTIEFKKK